MLRAQLYSWAVLPPQSGRGPGRGRAFDLQCSDAVAFKAEVTRKSPNGRFRTVGEQISEGGP
jgi:hypothetical protein